jgi:murein endopeptidase
MPEAPKNYLQIRVNEEYYWVHSHVINDIKRILGPYEEFKTPVPTNVTGDTEQPKAKGKSK